jgi:prophage antirepressor-like protein
MNAIQNFVFEENLVRVVERAGDTWFVGTDVCKALEIKNAPHALARLDDDERVADIAISDTSGTKYATIVSEAGAYRLVFTSRKEQAERFKRWLAHEVLPQIRRTGQFGAAAASEPVELDISHAPLAAKVSMLHFVLKTRGREAAVAYMDRLGLPALPPAATDDAPQQALEHLLASEAAGGTLRDLLRMAFAGEDVAAELAEHGLRAGDGVFYVASAHPFIRRRFRPTRWPTPVRLLRRLDGAEEARVMKYGRIPSRGVELPAFWADEA